MALYDKYLYPKPRAPKGSRPKRVVKNPKTPIQKVVASVKAYNNLPGFTSARQLHISNKALSSGGFCLTGNDYTKYDNKLKNDWKKYQKKRKKQNRGVPKEFKKKV